MLAGVGPVPAVLLVVAADEGWMPQSAEHVDALTALGVRHGLLVITRSDLMEPELARDEARAHLAGTPLAEIPAVCVSAATGAGMDALRAALADLAAALPVPDPHADVRLWVDRAFTIRGAGTVVTGTLPAGTLRVDDELELVGAERGPTRVTVRGLQSLGEPHGRVAGVARVAVNLRGVPRETVARGDVLLTPGRWLRATELDVRLSGVRDAAVPDTRGPDTSGPDTLPEQLTLHIGSAAVPVRVRPLGPDTARLRPAHPLPVRIGDRAVLRDPGRRRVLAGLTVLDVAPPPLRRRGAAARRAGELAGMTGAPDAAGELRRRGHARRADLLAMGVPAADLQTLRVPSAAGVLLDPDAGDRARRPPRRGRRGARRRRSRRPRAARGGRAPGPRAAGRAAGRGGARAQRDRRPRPARRPGLHRRAPRAAPGGAARPSTRSAPTCAASPSTPPRPPGWPSWVSGRASSRRWCAAGRCCGSPTAWCCCPAPTTAPSSCSRAWVPSSP